MHLTTLRPRLDEFYRRISAVILFRQHPVTGLLPASTAINSHGNYTDAWVRDNVYSILAVWGLSLAYRKLDEDEGRTYELEQSVVKLMRGLLFAMMQQAHKVERFKDRQDPLEALHAKYDTATGSTVVGDDEWGHLQLDATSLYLLMLAQMTASGLQIVFTLDEVNFVQNLVYYIGRAYRTPDYGIWERGNKINHGKPELNASSVGMAKAALEAIKGLNLFGVRGGQASVVHVLPDEISRARLTLESLLPRESGSKEVDAALLSIVGYPAFAVDNPELAQTTRTKVIEKLQGRYGCKRFLRDGHQTVIEDTTRLHYEPEELQQFEHIECEWPLFTAYLWLDALFRGDAEAIADYEQRLAAITVPLGEMTLLPELYYVPEDALDAERQHPGSQPRLPNENLPLVWAQSLYYLGQFLREGLLKPGDLDPLGRHLRVGEHRYPIVQIVLLAEDRALQEELSTYGISTQVTAELEPVQIYPAGELSAIFAMIGHNRKLGLTGRPIRRLRSLTTSRLFRINGEQAAFLPSFLDQQRFYLTLDYHLLVAQMRSELAYIYDHWREPGRPTVVMMLTHAMLQLGHRPIHESPLLALIQELKQGHCDHVPVRVGPMYQMSMMATTERIDDIHDYRLGTTAEGYFPGITTYLSLGNDDSGPLSLIEEFDLDQETNLNQLLYQLRESDNLYEQIELLSTLKRLKGLKFDTGIGGPGEPVTVAKLLEEIYAKASRLEQWAILRRAAGLLEKADITLSDALTELLVRQKQITVGKAYSEDSLITEPMPHQEITAKIRDLCGENVRDHVLTQEILIYLSVLIKSEPSLFEGLMTLRIGYLILLITSELARERQIDSDDAYEVLISLSPFEVKMLLRQVLVGYSGINQTIFQRESLRTKPHAPVNWAVVPAKVTALEPSDDWMRKRQIDGEIIRLPEGFYAQVWELLKHCRGIIIGNKFERRNRLQSEAILSEMTPGEQNFARRIDHLLNKIQAPEYRHLNIEALQELSEIVSVNPDLYFENYLSLDVLIGHAVRLQWLQHNDHRSDRYPSDKAAAWSSFYQLPPETCASAIANALQFLSDLAETQEIEAKIEAEEPTGATAATESGSLSA